MADKVKKSISHSVVSDSDYEEHSVTWDGFVRGCTASVLVTILGLLTLIVCAYGTSSTFVNMSVGFFGFVIGAGFVVLSSIRFFSTWLAPIIFVVLFGLCVTFLIV